MNRAAALFIAIVLCLAGTAYALYSVSNTGDWPKDWPKELEPLRKQSHTLVGPQLEQPHYAIPFDKRNAFEAAWPHLLKVKTKGAPIFLVRGENFFLDGKKAGVIVHASPVGTKEEGPIAGVTEPRMKWMNTTNIELVVDGDIVDLNRIPLPADTPIVDERFKGKEEK